MDFYSKAIGSISGQDAVDALSFAMNQKGAAIVFAASSQPPETAAAQAVKQAPASAPVK